MDDFLTTALYEPYLFIALLYAGLAITIVYNDITCFEIDILAVCAAAICVASLLLTVDINIINNLYAAGIMLILAALGRRFYSKGFGLGDYYLYAFMGFASGLALLWLMVSVNIILGLVTSAGYSKARKKPLFRSSFPAAVPGVIAATVCLAAQFFAPNSVQAFSSSLGFGLIEAQLRDIIMPRAAETFIAFSAIIASALVLVRRALGDKRISW